MNHHSHLRLMCEDLKRILTGRNLTICCAESLTTGNLQAALGSVSGSSAYFVGGVTAYNIDQKASLLGVNPGIAEPCNCVSQDVANQMARGVLKLFGADIALATTGYAEAWLPTEGVLLGPDNRDPAENDDSWIYPHAYYAIAIQDIQIVAEGRRDYPNEATYTRLVVQQAVTEAVIRELLKVL